MVLESTIICVDNSQFMRNGDFNPTRLQAQQVNQVLIPLAPVFLCKIEFFNFQLHDIIVRMQ